MDENILEMASVTKIFGENYALDDVDFSVKKGEVHALLGENGAGKSTLMNCLFGMYDHFEGEVFYRGHEVTIRGPIEAIGLGIGMVHQHFMLIPALTVIENVILGLKENKTILDLDSAANKFKDLSKKYRMEIDPWARVSTLSVGEQQRLEILKALYREAELLILDEPTAVLTPGEIDSLFEVIESLKNNGHTVIFISHKLGEVMRICDCCTILRRGKIAGKIRVRDIQDPCHLASLMVGHEVDLNPVMRTHTTGVEVLQVDNLFCSDTTGVKSVKDVTFSLREGEILGICGVEGNGQSELIEGITGLTIPTSGTVKINGIDVTNSKTRKRLNLGVSHIPEDRIKYGASLDMTLEDNIILISYNQKPLSRCAWLKRKDIKNYAQRICDEFNVKCTSISQKMRDLSGGNQQKLVVGRELSRSPKLLVAVHPSRGLDISATKYVQTEIMKQRNAGTGVIYVSTEISELLEMCDRILVMYAGEIMEILDAKDATRERLGSLMTGMKAICPSDNTVDHKNILKQ